MTEYNIKKFEDLKNNIWESLNSLYQILDDENITEKDKARKSVLEDIRNKINVIFLQDLSALHFMEDSEAGKVRGNLHSLFSNLAAEILALKQSIALAKSFRPSYFDVFENLQKLTSRATRIVSSPEEFRIELLGESKDKVLSEGILKEVDSFKHGIIEDLKSEVSGVYDKISLLKDELDFSMSSQESEIKKVASDLDDTISSINKQCVGLETKLTNLSEKFESDLVLVNDLYEEAEVIIENKVTQLDGLLSNASNRVMANDYDSSAVSEKKSADRLRYGSLGCMAIIVFIVCYTFYDSTHSGFDWESSIFRTVLVFILSIPAAYLSRESTKHREQQYNYHHTALDLKAITPYIASLPEVDQNRIKISIAERIFASRQTNLNQQDSFPLNTQELMMELIKK